MKGPDGDADCYKECKTKVSEMSPLATLEYNPPASTIARTHSDEMIKKGLSHF